VVADGFARDAAPPAFVPVFSAFAAGYLLSYLYRTVNAVISPELTRELDLAAGSLGFLTSAYFLAFGAMQIPVGILLDRYGPRRVEPVLLAIAACGALLFGLAQGLPGLTFGRAIIGAGVCACLMAPLKGIAMWYPPERHASLSGWIMVAGGFGALAATTPVELALRFVDWRTIFFALSAVTLAVALWIALRVPDTPRSERAAGVRGQFAGVRDVLAHPRFWWIAPVGGFGMGSFMALQGLWAVPWLMEVDGRARADAAAILLGMSVASLAGFVFLGAFATALARRGILARHLFAAGFSMNALAFAVIAFGLSTATPWWWLYGLGAAANVLGFSVLNEGFGPRFAGRSNTALNLVMFGTSFAVQWGVGVVVDFVAAMFEATRPDGLRHAFRLLSLLDLTALAWLFARWKRFAVVALPQTAP
jgi:predicted MFS family arabinose efflux permease